MRFPFLRKVDVVPGIVSGGYETHVAITESFPRKNPSRQQCRIRRTLGERFENDVTNPR